MHFSQSPQLIQVDPLRIAFHPANPRTHRGVNWLRLKNSLDKVGMVQFPVVRTRAANFFECLDGEGRVRWAQETGQKTVWVVCLGAMHDADALLLLQTANAVRSFSLLDECQGLAHLHQQGYTTTTLAGTFSIEPTKLKRMVAIGYFPDDVLTLIRNDMAQSEEQAQRWTYCLLRELLPLRQIQSELPEQAKSSEATEAPVEAHSSQAEETQPVATHSYYYDYSEVHRAISKVLAGEIPDAVHMCSYVAQRRLELFEERFDQTLVARVESERMQAKQLLAQDHAQEIQDAQQETAHQYQAEMQRLQQRVTELDGCFHTAVNKTAKQSALVAQLQRDLEHQTQETAQVRQQIATLRAQAQAEARLRDQEQQRQQEVLRQQLAMERQQQQECLEQEYMRTTTQLAHHYQQKEQDLELHAEMTIHQIVANCTHLLSDAQLAVLNLLSPEICKGLAWLHQSEIKALLEELHTVRQTLTQAEEQLLHGEVIIEAERRSANGSQPYQSTYENVGRG